jgi:hypothetical protein
LPFLRVIRDKRGYETTYLMHWFREGQRQRTKILYVFRSPGGVRVGRNVLEPDVMRQLEAAHPGIDFDWPSVRENKQVIETSPEPRRRPRRGSQEGDAPARPQKPAAAAPVEAPPPPKPSLPAVIEGATPDEQIAFLVTWYPQVRDRVVQRASDPSRREALLALAERLNPTNWTDADQITTGLQQASESLERLAHVFARRRRRARKRPGDRAADGDRAGDAVRHAEAADAAAPAVPPASPEVLAAGDASSLLDLPESEPPDQS